MLRTLKSSVLWRAFEQRFDARLGRFDVARVFDFDGDAAQVILAEQPHQTGVDRHENDIVLVAAVGRCAFFAHDADDDEGHAAHQDVLADRTAAVGK